MADEDSYTEVTEESWFSRIGSAFSGIIFGMVLFLAAFPLLFWNEGRAVKRYKTLQEGGGAVVSVAADRVDPERNGELVHVTGDATTSDVLIDPEFGVSVNALRLRRSVEMYQWEESKSSKKEKKLGGGERTVTTYSYDRVWTERPISSGGFKKPDEHRNPAAMPIQSESWTAEPVTLGAYTLPESLVNDISAFRPLDVKESAGEFKTIGDRECVLAGNGYYCGLDSETPEIGDLRISYREVPPTTVSLVAQQQGNSFTTYQTQAGGTISLLRTGTHSADAMFKQAETQNKWLTWILRGAGLLVMFMGLGMIFRPLSVVADVVPFVGSIVGAGTGMVAFLLAAMFSFVTIAVAWIFYRPLIGVILLVVAAAALAGVFMLFKKGKDERAAGGGAVPPPRRPSGPPPSPPPTEDADGGGAPPPPPPA